MVLPIIYIATAGYKRWAHLIPYYEGGEKLSVLCAFQSFSEGMKNPNHYFLERTILYKHAVGEVARIFCCIRCFHSK